MASGDAVQQIKDRLNIIDVISPYAELDNILNVSIYNKIILN